MSARPPDPPGVVIKPEKILGAREVVQKIYVDDKIKGYILDVVFATRDPSSFRLDKEAEYIEYGASPRASLSLARAARAHAFLRRRGFVTPEDVKAIGADVLRHRIILTYEAEAEEVTTEMIVRRVFETVEVP